MDGATTDSSLIERARKGDQDAFGELVRRHRAKAFDWARHLARDPHLAEDIVQEALMRAFLHLGTLADMNRFLPWLHRIVRNEALMKLRKAENSGRERTFAGIRAGRNDDGIDWGDLDSVIHYILGKKERTDDGEDPAAVLAQKEFLVTIRHLLRCLTPRERAVFEAHFFQQLSPAEIARLFRTTTDYVYQSLSRARRKVKEERTRIRLQDYIRERRDSDLPEKMVLRLKKGPGSGEWKRCKTSFAGAVYAVLPHAGMNQYSLTDVMGLSAQAFRLTVEEERMDATGPAMYFWESQFHDGLLNLGLESEHTGDGGAPPTPFMLNKSIAHVRRSIIKGKPVIAWDLAAPEFGIIYGYDDAEQMLYVEDVRGKQTLAYDRLGRGLSGGLFVLSFTELKPVNEWEAVLRALEMAVRHAYGEITFVGYVCGLAAYDCWKEAFRKIRIDPVGNAYTLDILAEARAYAADFLNELAVKLEAAGRRDSAAFAADAARSYGEAAEALKELSVLFPFPSGGTPNEPATARTAVEMIERAQSAEKTGIRLLERLNRTIRLIVNHERTGGAQNGDANGKSDRWLRI